MVVYPRWRGELDRTASVVSSGSGLSPLARGTPVFANLWTIAIRFIPAGAGNTGARNTKPCICSVYPRWRGEHWLCNSSTHDHVGLSPLARGTHYAFLRLPGFCRFIPAGAGNTLPPESINSWYAVYPRWRGEHPHVDYINIMGRGLSPLARGTRGCSVFHYAGWPVYPRWRGEHSKHNLLLINDFLSQSQSTNFIVSHKQHIHYVKEHLIHWLKR